MMLPASYHTGFAPRDGYPAYPELWRGCVGAWAPCLGPTGLTLRDWGGRQNHGTLTNMVPGDDWVVSGGRYALDFDGVNDNIPFSVNLSAFSTITVSLWFYWYAFANNDRLLMEYTSNYNLNAGFIVNPNDASGRFAINQNATPTLDQSYFTRPASATWHHLAFTLDRFSSPSITAFLNGIEWVPLSRTTNIPGTAFANSTLFFACRNSSTLFGNCQLDALMIHSRRLLTHEIRLLASRRGIAYEMYRPAYYVPQITSARRRKILTGQV